MDEDWDEELKNEPERKNFDYTSTYSSQQNEDKNNEQRSFGRGQGVGRESAFGNSNFGRGRGRGNNQSRGRGGNWRDNSRGQFNNDRPSWRNNEVNGFDNNMSSDRGRGGFSGNNSMSSDRGRGGFSGNNSMSSDRGRGGFDGNNSMSSDRGGFRNNGMSSDRGGFRGNRNMSSDSSRVFETVEVLNDSIGKLIGRGGSKIREIQDTSGARVTINQDDASNSLTPVKISGTREQVEKAQQMIKDATIPAGDLKAWAEREDRKYADEQPQGGFKINWKQLKQDAETYERTRWAGLPKVIKNIYNEKENIANMSHEEAEAIRLHKNNITCQDLCVDEKRKIPNPVLTFEDAFLEHPEILETIYNNKFQEPSPIQSQAWPILLSGMDCIGIAQTGTGKTLAFLLPAFLHIDQQPVPRHERGGPSCLVLSPTRELAQQIESEVKKFHYRNIRSICIYGGGDRHKQIKELQQGVEIVIGTPGRLNDLLMNNFFKVTSVTYLILDEADRMLDMGFEPEIKKILLDIRPDRQTIMTSATWLPGVQRIADQYLKNPIRVNVGSLDLQACHDVTQLVEFIDLQNKQNRTLEFIQSMEPEDKLIIFVGRKITADDISSNFALMDIEVGIQCIHGDRDQLDREQALADLKSGKARVLIATDVASRGLDVKDLTHVLNYDFPRHIEDYVHRIGRTGRAGRTGCALTFVTREDWMHVGKLIPIMEEAGQEIPIELYEMAQRWDKQREERRSAYGGGRGGGRDGNSRGCFKCGKEGHFSRECPEGGGGGGGGGGFGGRPRRDKRNVGMRVLACDAV